MSLLCNESLSCHNVGIQPLCCVCVWLCVSSKGVCVLCVCCVCVCVLCVCVCVSSKGVCVCVMLQFLAPQLHS